jgi:ABC-type multidrug transport system fused ATPase/permease subunit
MAAGRIFKVIDRKPKIVNTTNSIIIKDFKGIIKFTEVSFSYPKYKSKKILDKLSL